MLTKEQIEFLNTKCKSIYISEDGDSFRIGFLNTVYINANILKNILENLTDKSKITNLVLEQKSIPYDVLKQFVNVQSITCHQVNLSLAELGKIKSTFNKIKDIYFGTVDENVLEAYSDLDIKIRTHDTKFNCNPNNRYITKQNKFCLKDLVYLNIFEPINYTWLNEIVQYCSKINILNIFCDNLEEIRKILLLFKSRNINIKMICLKLENRNYDLNILKQIFGEDTTIQIKYDNLVDASIDDFENMRWSLNYYIGLIKNKHLSPIEEIMFAYDIVKSFTYRYSENPMDSRCVHNVLNTGDIVCVGYARLLSALLTELGYKIDYTDIYSLQDLYEKEENIDFVNPAKSNHERNIIRVDDNKYNIHGLFVLDATWDSNKRREAGLNKYSYFLVPLCDYKKTFPYDNMPILFSYYLDLIDLDSMKGEVAEIFKSQMIKFFGEISKTEDFYHTISTSPVEKEQFNQILSTVRLAEGYSSNEIGNQINKAVYFNNENSKHHNN